MKTNIYVIHMLSLIFRISNVVNAHTIDSIYESILSYQNGIIEEEKQHFLNQEHNEYIYFKYEAQSREAKQYMQDIFVTILQEYSNLKKNLAIDFDCLKYYYDYRCDNFFLNNFLNIIKFMHERSEKPENNYKIYKNAKEYRFEASFHKNKKILELVQIFKQNFNEQNLIINNCLKTIEDYAIFLNETNTRLVYAKNKNKFIMLCFHFDDIEQKNKWNELFNNFDFIKNRTTFYYKIIRLMERFPSYHKSIEGPIELFLGKSYETEREKKNDYCHFGCFIYL